MKHGISVEIGSAPWEEDCAQVGEEDYSVRVRKELNAYKAQILRHYPKPVNDDQAVIKVSYNQHEFGAYRELEIVFDPASKEACEWAYQVEADPKAALARWDDEAQLMLDASSAVSA